MSIKEKSILIIDDDQEIIKLLTKIFEVLGVIIYSAHNLEEAKKVVQSNIPHLIFLDIRLGNENGLDYLTFLKSYPFGSSIPVIVFSGIDDKRIQKLAIMRGAVDYINKPIIASQLIQKVRKHLKDTYSNYHIFKEYNKSPQVLRVPGTIVQLNQNYMEVETSVNIANSTSLTMHSSLCEKIKFTDAKFTSGYNTQTLASGHFLTRLYYLGASDTVLQNINLLRSK